MIAKIILNTTVIVNPKTLKGNNSNHAKGKKISAMIANGQQIESKMNQSIIAITAFIEFLKFSTTIQIDTHV